MRRPAERGPGFLQAAAIAALLLSLPVALTPPAPASARERSSDAHASPMTAPEYRSRLSELAAIAAEASKQARVPEQEERVDAEVARLMSLLPVKRQVLFEGERITVDNTELLQTLEEARALSQSARRSALLGRLATMMSDIAAGAAETGSRRANRRILMLVVEEARLGKADFFTDLSTKLASWLRRVFADRFDLSPRSSGPFLPAPPSWLLIFFALAIIAITSVLLSRAALRRGRGLDLVEPALETKKLDADESDPAERALRLAREGERRAALGLLFRSLQAKLQEGGIARYRPSDTASEYAYLVSSSHTALRRPLLEMLGVFEIVTYGMRECTVSDFERFESRYHQVLEAALDDQPDAGEHGPADEEPGVPEDRTGP